MYKNNFQMLVHVHMSYIFFRLLVSVSLSRLLNNQYKIYTTGQEERKKEEKKEGKKETSQHCDVIGSGPGRGQLRWPCGITIDTAGTGLVYVSEFCNNRVSVFTSDSVFVSSFGSKGSNIDQFNNPHGLTFNREELLYVCDFSNDRLVVYY